jgi:hypothetical protein
VAVQSDKAEMLQLDGSNETTVRFFTTF